MKANQTIGSDFPSVELLVLPRTRFGTFGLSSDQSRTGFGVAKKSQPIAIHLCARATQKSGDDLQD
jgi:hypothetical protein